jgi:dolichol-phosphate mannosyltransferase
MRTLIAIPVYNEERYVRRVLDRVLAHAGNVLVIDDGSSDRTPDLIADYPVDVIRHAVNHGYGRSIRDAFMWARAEQYDWVITMDCDEQHEPASIPDFMAAAEAADAPDIISGSRYLRVGAGEDDAPSDRRAINAQITEELNARFGLRLTDAFCGFKSHRVEAISRLDLSENGYAFPMEFWAQAVAMGLSIGEIPVRRIYNDPARTFGGPLDDPAQRLAHYRAVLHKEIRRFADRLPGSARAGLCMGYCPR